MKKLVGLLVLVAGVAGAAIPQSERDVLIALYNSTKGDSWTTKTNWNSDGGFSDAGTECTWFGITCTDNSVTAVTLPGNSLTGSIPSLTGLTNLQMFYVNNNHLTGSIPSLTGLTNLYYFQCDYNQLTGNIPSLTGLTNLAYFIVNSNQLTGSIPPLTGLTNLQQLYVYDNQLTGNIPSLTGLTNLQWFIVYNNQFTGSIPALTGLTRLQGFYVFANQLTGSIPPLTGLTNLQWFFVYNNRLTGSIPSLTDVTKLLQFNISANQLTGSIPSLKGLTNLQRFYVNNNRLTGSIPSLTGLTNLQRFYVDNNQLTGEVPAPPSPSSLVSGAAAVCPNYLTRSASTAWDKATGSTPWYNTCLAAVTPGAPTIGTASAGNTRITVTFTAPAFTGGSVITGYTAACGSVTATGTTSPIVVNGLTNGTARTCTVTATNGVGIGLASAASNSSTPVAVAGAPTMGTASGRNGTVTVTFTAPGSTGGMPITGYTVTCGTATATGTTSPITVTGLRNGTTYTCKVTATNAFGNGDASSASNSVTPMADLAINPLGSMTISVVPNQSLLATGAVTVTANQSGSWTASTSTPWLSLTQSNGGFPGTVAGLANAAGLAPGTYTGSISVAGTAVGGIQTVSIPVTLTVNSPAALTANPTSISMASINPAGSATGYTIQTGAAGLAFTVSTSASSADWLTVSPAYGIAPTPITVTLDPSQAAPGTHTDSIVISSPGVASVTVPVQMAVSGIVATLPQQVNAATQAAPDHTVAPNQLVTLYLADFSCATSPVVSINGTAVSWSSYSPGQLSYAVPASITTPAALTVACDGTTEWSFNGLMAAAVVPGIFTLTGTGKGQAATVNSDGTINGSKNPATRGNWLSVYGTGFGVFNEAGTKGYKTVAGTVTATIGGVDAIVLYAGNSPGATDGLQQFNLQIPAGVTAGAAVPVVITVNGTPTQTTATVSLK